MRAGKVVKGPEGLSVAGSARFAMTLNAASFVYLMWLWETLFKAYCSVPPRPYPNPNKLGNEEKPVTQYAFSTLMNPLWVCFHNLFYVGDPLLEKSALLRLCLPTLC